jgi:hypothetical protein
MTSKHEYDSYCDTIALEEPDYHEQLLVVQEMKEAHEAKLKQHGAIDALQNLTVTLSALCLRDDVRGDYFIGLHTALEVAKSKLDMMRGGVA